jgi:hypothetical protein
MSTVHTLSPIFLQAGGSGGGAGGAAGFDAGMFLPGLLAAVIGIVLYWILFSKAGQPGWFAIIPIWSTIVLLRIVGRPWWWLLLLFIPIVNIIIYFIVALDLGKSFGYGALFSILLLFFLPVIGVLVLDFGGSTYRGPGGAGAGAPAPAPA